jgi:Mrp family chromosome partitioning ATPase
VSAPRPVATVTASGGAAWEPGLLARLAGRPELQVVRRCVDLVDLIATAGTGTARAALVGTGLHRLDRDAVARLRSAGVAVVGIAAGTDPAGKDRLLALGVATVLEADAPADAVATAVLEAVAALSPTPRAPREDRVPAGRHPAPQESGGYEPTPALPAMGRLVAVWGPTGAPGRTTVAVNLAAELAAAGVETLLADADTYGASVAQHLGMLDEAPGLAAAVRAAGHGGLEPAGLARHARQLNSRLRVLSGIPRASRWPELRPAALQHVWEVCRQLAAVTVVDCGFSLEQDEDVTFDVSAPRRNAATLITLERADLVVVVGAADPIGMQRLVRAVRDLYEVVPGVHAKVVVNRVRRTVAGDSAKAPVRVLRRHAGVEDVLLVPDNLAAMDAALMAGRPLLEVVPRAPARLAVRRLADDVMAAAPAPEVSLYVANSRTRPPTV